MTKNEWLLTQLASECNEVAHRITIALQFGLRETQVGQPLNNEERVRLELTDLFAVLEMCKADGIISSQEARVADFVKKRAKVYAHMDYAKALGVLKP